MNLKIVINHICLILAKCLNTSPVRDENFTNEP